MYYLMFRMKTIPEISAAYYMTFKGFDSGWLTAPGIQMIYFVRGVWELHTSDQTYIIPPDSLAIYPRSSAYRVISEKKGENISSHYSFMFSPNEQCEVLSDADFLNHVMTIDNCHDNIKDIYEHKLFIPFVYDLNGKDYIAAMFKQIVKEWECRKIHSRYSAEILLQNMLVTISRSIVENALDTKMYPAGNTYASIQAAINYINDNYNTIKGIQKIARQVSLNPCYLSTIFKKHMGMTIVEYTNKVRIDNAVAFLHQKNYSFRQIASMVGIDDVYYFSKLFKKYTGMTMSQYLNYITI